MVVYDMNNDRNEILPVVADADEEEGNDDDDDGDNC